MLVRDQAEALLREAQLRAKAGLVGPNQVANAQVFLASQQLALLDREEALDRVSEIAIRADAEALRALAQGADRDRLPTVDLVGTLGGNGLSGTGQDVVFGADTLRATASGGYGDA